MTVFQSNQIVDVGKCFYIEKNPANKDKTSDKSRASSFCSPLEMMDLDSNYHWLQKPL